MSPSQNSNDEHKHSINKFLSESKKVMDNSNMPTYAQKLQLDSFNKLKEQLAEQDKLTDENELILTLKPKDLAPGEISVRALTTITGGFQALTDSIANTLFNQSSKKGKIPQEILDQNELIFKESKAGSFKAIIGMKQGNQLFSTDDQSQVLSETFELLYSTRNDLALSEKVTELGPRTLRTLIDWSKDISELEIPLNLSWHSKRLSKHNFSGTSNANEINQTLSQYFTVSEEEVIINGLLVGANTRTKTFELIKNNGEKINGKIAKHALIAVAPFTLGKECKATLLKVTTRSSTVKQDKIKWTLNSIEPL